MDTEELYIDGGETLSKIPPEIWIDTIGNIAQSAFDPASGLAYTEPSVIVKNQGFWEVHFHAR